MLTLLAIPLFATPLDSLKHPLPLKIAVLDESISLPNFWFTRYAFNPALLIGTEYPIQQKGKHEWYVAANLGFYHHKKSQSAIFINGELGYRYFLGRWRPASSFGLAYAHTFYPGPVYESVDGIFQEVSNSGHPTFMPSLAIHLGYQLSTNDYPPELFLTFMSGVDIPFRQETSLHQFVGLGLKLYPFQ